MELNCTNFSTRSIVLNVHTIFTTNKTYEEKIFNFEKCAIKTVNHSIYKHYEKFRLARILILMRYS